MTAQLRVDGLTPLQLAELRAAVGADVEELDAPSLGGGKAGEPAILTAVIALGPSVISAIALWIAKQKKGRTKKLRYTRIDSDGGMESFELDESSYAEGESSATAIQTFLQKKLGNDATPTS